MDFDLTEEQKLLQSTLRDFADKEIAPAAARIDKSGEFPAAEIKKMADLGLFGLTIPEKYGGSGKGLLELCIAVEELARASAAVDNYLRVSLSLAIVPVMQFGTEAQKKSTSRPMPAGSRWPVLPLPSPAPAATPPVWRPPLRAERAAMSLTAASSSSASASMPASWWSLPPWIKR